MHSDFHSSAIKLAELLTAHRGRIVIYTGAGISTVAGIPDYRGTNGIWTNRRPDNDADALTAKRSRPMRRSKSVIHVNRRSASNGPPKLRLPEATFARPTFTHMAIKTLVELGYVRHVVSQNVDGLHLRSGLDPQKLSELHGNLFLEQCVSCGFIVKRAFDVAECTGRSSHFTGRVCPRCHSERSSEWEYIQSAFDDADRKELPVKRIRAKGITHVTESKSTFTMHARRTTAANLSRQFRSKSATEEQYNGDPRSAVYQGPFLRDVIVHFHERQPYMGLAQIYRVRSAIEAIYGLKLLYGLTEECLSSVQSDGVPPNTHPSWLQRILPALIEERINDASDKSIPDVPLNCHFDPASLIIVLGSSLQILRSYAFLWPQGLTRCVRNRPRSSRLSLSSPFEQGSTVSSHRAIDAMPSTKSASKHCHLAIVNLQSTCKDGLADLVAHFPCDDLLKAALIQHMGIQVEPYSHERDDLLFREFVPLKPFEIHTRTRPDIPFETFFIDISASLK